jgi:uncharacterized protein YbbK (DUF523 family)
MKLCSACLLGINCKYDGRNNLNKAPKKLIEEYKKGNLIPVCPEQLGGLPTPRILQEIQGCSGEYVLEGKCKVKNKYGKDVTNNYLRGAEAVLKIAKDLNIKEAILKQRSPSCGCGQIYDGTFSKTIIKGDGVTTALLKKNGVKVITEEDL